MHPRLLAVVLLLPLTARAAEMGTIIGVVDRPVAVATVVAVDRHSGEKDRRFPGKLDLTTGRFVIAGLPLGPAYDLVLDFNGARLEGVDLRVKRSDYEEEQPLTAEDVKVISERAKSLNKFEDEVDVMVVKGNTQHAAVLLNKRRTKPFYESKPGEMIWRLELWQFEKPEDAWIKSRDTLFTIFHRERLQKDAFERKSLTLDPALGGLVPTKEKATIDVGTVPLPEAKPGIRLREGK